MMKHIILVFTVFLFTCSIVSGQKKPLDHTVYDSWQSIGEKLISNDGRFVVYSVDVQEGDNELFVRSTQGDYRISVPRGDDAVISFDSRFVVCRIRPPYAAVRQAKIKKVKPDDMPKDSMAIIELGKPDILKVPRLRGFRLPEKSGGWLAYQLEKAVEAGSKGRPDNRKSIDSLQHVIDSLQQVILNIPRRTPSLKDADGDDNPVTTKEQGTTLMLRNLASGTERKFFPVTDYQYSKKGRKLVMEVGRDPKDSTRPVSVLLMDLVSGQLDTISRGGNDFRHFVFSEDETQLAFVAERNANPRDLQKYYKLWYHRDNMDTAEAIVDKNSVGMLLGMSVSEYGRPQFSQSGARILFGTTPILAPKDTTLVEIDMVKLDVWHYNDDYLQTQQLLRRQRDSADTYLAIYFTADKRIRQLATPEIPVVYPSGEGDGLMFAGLSDVGNRVATQWAGNSRKTIYAIDPVRGTAKEIRKHVSSVLTTQYLSPSGRYIMWFDLVQKNYFVYNGDSVRNISSRIKVSLVEEENDVPDYPRPYGLLKWMSDETVLLYDRYGAWKVNPANPAPTLIFDGRKTKTRYRYIQTDRDEKFIDVNKSMVLRSFSDVSRYSGFGELIPTGSMYKYVAISPDSAVFIGTISKALNSQDYIYTKESYTRSPDLYFTSLKPVNAASAGTFTINSTRLSSTNPQQKNYNWGTAELYKWKAFNNKPAEGILYKPEDFSPSKKYPVIFYFYEKLTDGLYQYHAPAPTPSRLNISFFVSRGYLVLVPDINYTIGHPAKSAYDYIVSGAKDLATQPWVDGKNMGLQGQSWGGIQVAQLITMTDIFKAAWAGAPVANMTSAYGGIRWESGLNRQFQYEKTQSRIGATLWEKPELYIENSPLFHLPKVKTPLVIMANDADGAVPWYQGIELFTGMRRLGKKVWMLNYNGEAHNLVQRKNRKDIQIREQQFFDWLLKGERPARWLTEGIPASRKGKDWGL